MKAVSARSLGERVIEFLAIGEGEAVDLLKRADGSVLLKKVETGQP